jgi:hypothetical protein
MERWEYMSKWINQPQRDSTLEVASSTHATLKALGEEGWEMVTILPMGTIWLVWFKRKLS